MAPGICLTLGVIFNNFPYRFATSFRDRFSGPSNEQLAQELISSDATFCVSGQPEPMRGPEGYLAIIGMMRSGFEFLKNNPTQFSFHVPINEAPRWFDSQKKYSPA